jgi:hypothetical protein
LSLSSVLDNSGRGMVKRAVGTMNFNVDIPSCRKLLRLCTVVPMSCGCSRGLGDW